METVSIADLKKLSRACLLRLGQGNRLLITESGRLVAILEAADDLQARLKELGECGHHSAATTATPPGRTRLFLASGE